MFFCDLSHTYHKQVTNFSPACFCHPTVGNVDVFPNLERILSMYQPFFQRLTFLTTPTDDWGPPPEVSMTEMKSIEGAKDAAGSKLLNGNEAGPV